MEERRLRNNFLESISHNSILYFTSILPDIFSTNHWHRIKDKRDAIHVKTYLEHLRHDKSIVRQADRDFFNMYICQLNGYINKQRKKEGITL